MPMTVASGEYEFVEYWQENTLIHNCCHFFEKSRIKAFIRIDRTKIKHRMLDAE
jgi:hypothetical protein